LVQEGNFGLHEAMWVLSLFCCSKILIEFPSIAISIGGSAGWFIAFMAAIIGWIGFQIIVLLLKRFPGQTIVEAGTLAAGPIIGTFAASLYLIFFIVLTSIVLREFSESVKVIALPNTPMYVVIAIFLVGAAFCVYLGMAIIARVTVLVTFITLFIVTLAMIFLIHECEIRFLLPIMGTGYKDVLLGSLIKSSNFSELLFAGLIVNSVGGWQRIRKATKYAVIMSAIVGSISVAIVTMLLGVYVGEETILPLFTVIKEISFGKIFQRVESFFLIFWVAIGLLYVSIGFYGSVIIFTRMCKLKNYKPLIPIFMIAIFVISILPRNLPNVMFIDNSVIRSYSWIISYVVPLIILIIAVIRKKKIDDKDIKEQCNNE